MKGPQEIVCFTCGQPAGDFPRLNCLPGGQVCPTCRDRLLESLPSCLPSEHAALEEVEGDDMDEAYGESWEADSADEEPQGSMRVARGPGAVLHGKGLSGSGPDQPA